MNKEQWELFILSRKWWVDFDLGCGKWDCSYNIAHKAAGTVYMPERIAGNLCRKLNSGEVEL